MYLPSGFLLLFQRDLANHFPRTSGGVRDESKEHKGSLVMLVHGTDPIKV